MIARHSARLLPPIESTCIPALAHCHRLEITVPLNEFETAKHSIETWPDEVARIVRRQVEDWMKHNGERAIVCLSTAVIGADKARTCVLIIHHDAKGGAPAPVPAGDLTPGPTATAPGRTGELALGPPTSPRACAMCAE